MAFTLNAYGADVQAILALAGNGSRAMPLAHGTPVQAGVDALAGRSASDVFPGASHPEAALAGLYLYFCAYDQAHAIAQDDASAEGSFWHGILHRQEPDPGNAGYWFRRVGRHAIFPALRSAAAELAYGVKNQWDPFAFIDYCESARRKPGSRDEEIAMAVQLAEWQLLFDYCARSSR
jgi:hypothetical protein